MNDARKLACIRYVVCIVMIEAIKELFSVEVKGLLQTIFGR
jgi:hypothetical protein